MKSKSKSGAAIARRRKIHRDVVDFWRGVEGNHLTVAEIREKIDRAARRLETLRAVARGEVRVRSVYVKAHRVPTFHVPAHYRNITITKKAACLSG